MSIEYREFRESVRKLAQTKIAPHAADVDDKERFPSESWAALRSNDLPGLAYPESLGGSGADLLAQVIAVEEVAASCASTALVMLVNWAGTSTVLRQGSDELKRLVVPNVASGAAGAAWCMTEPRVGSDLSAIATTATQDGSDWILNGQKRFISNAPWADWYAVLAKTGEKSLGIFMVHKDDAGVSFGAPEKKMGMRGSPTTDVNFDECRLPAVRVVNDPTRVRVHLRGTERQPGTHRRAGSRHRTGRIRCRSVVHDRPRAVRPVHLPLPASARHGRRYGRQDRVGPHAAVRRSPSHRRRGTGGTDEGGHGEAAVQRHRHVGDHRCAPTARRIRLCP